MIELDVRELSVTSETHNSLFMPACITPIKYHILPWSGKNSHKSFSTITNYSYPLVIPIDTNYCMMFLGDKINTACFVTYYRISNAEHTESIRVGLIRQFPLFQCADFLPVRRIKVHAMALFREGLVVDPEEFYDLKNPIFIKTDSFKNILNNTYQGILLCERGFFKIRYSYEENDS